MTSSVRSEPSNGPKHDFVSTLVTIGNLLDRLRSRTSFGFVAECKTSDWV